MKLFKRAELIEMLDDTADYRKWKVRLSPQGQVKVNGIREGRLVHLAPVVNLLENAPDDERQIVLKYLGEMGKLYWEHATVEAFKRAEELQKKKRIEDRVRKEPTTN
jgi:DNA-binding MarR family transcriptional regulator